MPGRVTCGIDRRFVGEQLVERRLERRPAARRALHRDDDVERELERSGDLDRRGDVPDRRRELGLGPVDRASPLDDALRQPDEARRLGQRVADRAANLEPRERLEVDAACGIERIDRGEQADATLLHEIVERDAQPAVVCGDGSHARQVLFDETLAGATTASRLLERRRLVCVHRLSASTVLVPCAGRHRAELRIATGVA